MLSDLTIGQLQKQQGALLRTGLHTTTEGEKRVFVCVVAKPLICIRTAQVQGEWAPTATGWPRQTDLCLATSWVLSQIGEKADKKHILQRWDNAFYYDNVLSYTSGSGVNLPCREVWRHSHSHGPEGFHPF